LEKNIRTIPKKTLLLEGKILVVWRKAGLAKLRLNSLPMFMMSFEIPKGVLKNLDFFRSRFF